jgi:hypothetical protein
LVSGEEQDQSSFSLVLNNLFMINLVQCKLSVNYLQGCTGIQVPQLSFFYIDKYWYLLYDTIRYLHR